MERFAKDLGEESDREEYASRSAMTFASFNEKFWDERRRCLHDVLEGDNDKGDRKTRPNQIFSISLPFPVLEQSRWRETLRLVESELLTPVGLRTLSPFDAEYRGHYAGKPADRDRAYHQGTVWTWLLGAYVSAYVKVFPQDSKTVSFVRAVVQSVHEKDDRSWNQHDW